MTIKSELFFFYKQKTAYDMRISDWSSDVCSADLGGPGVGHARRQRGHLRIVQRAEDRIGGGQALQGYALRHHARVAEDRRARPKRGDGGEGEGGGKADMGSEVDQSRRMDHADGDSFLLGREAGEIGFGADGAEGLPVDGGSVGFVAMGHQGLPKRARTCRAVRPVFSGGDPARALRDRDRKSVRVGKEGVSKCRSRWAAS